MTTYHFRARRYQDIDLPRIAREIGDAPYALVELDNQRVVIAGERARLRGKAVSYDPTVWRGWCGLAVDVAGSLRPNGPGQDVVGWYGPDSMTHAAEWWAEVRRRERPDVVVTVTPALP